jgi:hypothetical protein
MMEYALPLDGICVFFIIYCESMVCVFMSRVLVRMGNVVYYTIQQYEEPYLKKMFFLKC